MITLEEAIKLDEQSLKEVKADIKAKVKESKLNAYIGEIKESNPSGVPILIKDNINVKEQEDKTNDHANLLA